MKARVKLVTEKGTTERPHTDIFVQAEDESLLSFVDRVESILRLRFDLLDGTKATN